MRYHISPRDREFKPRSDWGGRGILLPRLPRAAAGVLEAAKKTPSAKTPSPDQQEGHMWKKEYCKDYEPSEPNWFGVSKGASLEDFLLAPVCPIEKVTLWRRLEDCSRLVRYEQWHVGSWYTTRRLTCERKFLGLLVEWRSACIPHWENKETLLQNHCMHD